MTDIAQPLSLRCDYRDGVTDYVCGLPAGHIGTHPMVPLSSRRCRIKRADVPDPVPYAFSKRCVRFRDHNGRCCFEFALPPPISNDDTQGASL